MPLFFAFGFFALFSQVLLLREISFLFTAHELSTACALAFWLFWTGAGIKAAQKLRLPDGDRSLAFYFSLFALAAPASMLAARQAARLAPAGLMPGFLAMIAGTLLLTMPAGLAGGLAAAAGLRLRGAAFYAAEAAGGALAGLFTLFYLRYFPSFGPLKAAAASGALLALAAIPRRMSIPGKTAVLASAAAVLVLFWLGDARSVFLKGGARPAEVFDTTGSRLTASPAAGGTAAELTENGTLLAALPDESGTYETLALPLLARPRAQKIFVAGEKALFAARELLKHKPAALEVAEPDRFRADLILRASALPPGRVTMLSGDARNLLAVSTGGYSAIVLAADGPVNAAANRLYTLEFFRLAAEKLTPGGLLLFELPFSENYVAPEQGYLAACLVNTARLVFQNVALIPGAKLTVIASAKPYKLEPAAMAAAYEQRKLRNRSAVPSAFPFLLDPYRAQWAAAALTKAKRTQTNSDLDPVSYFYFWRLWFAMVAEPPMLLGLALTALILIVSFAGLFASGEPWRERAGVSSLLIGFWGMAFEAGIILLFQTLTGQLAWKLGALFSAFLAGAALGALIPLKTRGAALLPAEFTALTLSALTAEALKASFAWGLNTVFICSLSALAAAGAVSGAYFSAASALSPQRGPGVYARDLAGAALGAFTASAFAVPLWGLRSAFLLSAAAALLSLLIDGWRYSQSPKS